MWTPRRILQLNIWLALRSLALDNGLGLTPPMGWSSWNAAGSTVNESYVKKVTNIGWDAPAIERNTCPNTLFCESVLSQL